MPDLALGIEVAENSSLFPAAPDNRHAEVQQQLRRPAFSRVAEPGIRYLPYSGLRSRLSASALTPNFAICAGIGNPLARAA